MRPENFKSGDRVRHVGRDEMGVVKILRNGDVRVEFDKPSPSGNPSIGVYDANWFSTYPNGIELVFPPTDTGA